MSCPFKKYSEIFGKPNTGFHSFRIFDIAMNDLLGTIVISGLISYSFNFNFLLVLIILLLIAIILHRLFCVDTTINKLIFGKVNK
jgi:uncharacterized membrane protein YcaP (DUF421 family)